MVQCAESLLRLHQAKARPPSPTSTTPAMMAGRPGSPKPGPSPALTAAAAVGLADLVTGVFQFDDVDGAAGAGVAPGELVVASADGAATAALGSGARVGAGSGAGAAGWGAAGGPGSTGGPGTWGGSGGFGSGFRWTSAGGSVTAVSQDSTHVGEGVGVGVGDSA
jgi:hypothetical protein